MRIASRDAALIKIDEGRLIKGIRVGVSESLLTSPQPAVLRLYPGQIAEERRVAFAIPRSEMSGSALAVGSDFADEIGLSNGVGWELSTDGFEHIRLQEVSLESTVEGSLERAVSSLSASANLCGTLLCWAAGEELTSLTLEVDGAAYRLRSLVPTPERPLVILEITEETRLQLFSPGAKSGVDIVILADCSGSMDIDDLADDAERPSASSFIKGIFGARRSAGGLKRIEAVRQALRQLLDLRLKLAGKVSRVALVAFHDRCEVRFPRNGGMQEMDEGMSTELVQEFKDAITLLHAEDARTDIGQALHFAGELLYRNGHPSNDRLVVLISDGAHWARRGEEAAGEETLALKEPVSLMAHLHRDMRIHLHAIGISNDEIFMRWYRSSGSGRGPKPPESWVPNHELLGELVRVGGGDPSRTGDSDVLQDYFSGLGSGVTRRIKLAKRLPLPEPTPRESAKLRATPANFGEVSQAQDWAEAVRCLATEAKELYERCLRTCNELGQSRPFKLTEDGFEAFVLKLSEPVNNESKFADFIIAAHKLLYEARTVPPRFNKNLHREEVEAALYDHRLKSLNALRIVKCHDMGVPSTDQRQADNIKRASDAMQRHAGEAEIDPNDARAWISLQLGILKDIRDVLQDLCAAYILTSEKRPGTESGARINW